MLQMRVLFSLTTAHEILCSELGHFAHRIDQQPPRLPVAVLQLLILLSSFPFQLPGRKRQSHCQHHFLQAKMLTQRTSVPALSFRSLSAARVYGSCSPATPIPGEHGGNKPDVVIQLDGV